MLYGAKTWKTTKIILQKMKIFFNTISSASAISDGLERSQIRNYGLMQGSNHHTLKSIRGNKQGTRERGDVQEPPVDGGYWVELKAQDMTWQDAANLVCWRIVVDSLCFLWNDTSKLSSNLTDIGVNKNALVFTIK